MDKQKRKQYKKDYLSKFEGFYLYVIKNSRGKIVYVGATTNYMTRLGNHICGNAKATKKFISKANYRIQYLDLGEVITEQIEMYALENELIELYATDLNHKNLDGSYRLTDVSTIADARMFSLISYVHNIELDWITYCTKKRGQSTSKRGKVNG